jgi:hypothetical protein
MKLKSEIGSQLWETLYAEVVINRAGETVTENIKISAKENLGYYELKKHKPWFEEGCSELLDQKKQAKLQWLHDLNQINGDSLNNVRCADSRHFSHKNMECLKDRIDELATNRKNKSIRNLYRGIYKFKKGYQPRSNLVKDENGDLLADSHRLLTHCGPAI